jgi:long-chain fatty acid transport protein
MPRTNDSICSTLLLLAVTAPATSALADQYHYNNMLIGDRATGMGGAYTAISDDTSGLFYNPAGIVYSPGANISGSLNAIHSTSTSYKKVLGDQDWERESFVFIPNFFGVVQSFAGGMVGFSYAVTDAVLEDQDQRFDDFTLEDGTDVDSFYINFNNQDTTYNIGPSYAYKLRDNFSVGVTLYGFYRHQQIILNQQGYPAVSATPAADDPVAVWNNQYYELTEVGVDPVIGVMWSPLDKISLGLSVRKTTILSSERVRQDMAATEDDPTSGAPLDEKVFYAPVTDKSTRTRALPWQVSAGAAWFVSEQFVLAGDLNYFSAAENFNSVVNFALGTEYYFNSRWAMRGGFYSNLANTPKLSTTELSQPEHVDLYGISLSLTHFTRNSAFSAGFASSYGTGSAQVLDGSYTLHDANIGTVTVFLSGTYSY